MSESPPHWTAVVHPAPRRRFPRGLSVFAFWWDLIVGGALVYGWWLAHGGAFW